MADFLEDEQLVPTVSGRMGSGNFDFEIKDTLHKNNRIVKVKNSQIEIEMMDVTFTYENKTDYDVQNIFLNITDTNYVQGSDYEETQAISLSDFIDGTYTFSYAVGHIYQLSTSYSVLGDDGYYDSTTLYLNEWYGTNVGAENYIERHGTINGLYLLKATTQGIEIPLVISDTN